MSRVLPILFNGDMVRAILDGRKTVTRRVIKPQPIERLAYALSGHKYGTWGYPDKNAWKSWGDKFKQSEHLTEEERKKRWTPPCHTDDILYVRETVCRFDCEHCYGDSIKGECLADDGPDEKGGCWMYRATDEVYGDIVWRPSIHMPKEAARIWLKVTNVRVERLHDITDDGCMKEGIRAWTKDGKLYKYFMADEEGDYPNCEWSKCPRTPKEAIKILWDSTIKKANIGKYGWATNPWVWVIEFERCGKPESE